MKPPIGVSSFQEIVQKNSITGEESLYFDKTLMIKDLVEDPSKFLLFTRPRRFGKTLNMDMLRCFFSQESDLFHGLQIANYPKIFELFHGKVPTIFLSLKDVVGANYATMTNLFTEQLKKSLRNFVGYDFMKVFSPLMDKADWEFEELVNTIALLSEKLSKHHQTTILVLLDEYDAPMNNAYVEGFLPEAFRLMKSFFSQTFKDNPYLYKGIITGISRIARENLFSGLNSVMIYNIDRSEYSQYFGFTQEEIDSLKFSEEKKQEVKEWYNGYNFGGRVIYNPWSILHYIKSNFRAEPYWSNTGGMTTIEQNITLNLTRPLSTLLKNESLPLHIEDSLIYEDLENNTDAFLNMLYNAGYFTACSDFYDYNVRDIRIVNHEVLRYMQRVYLRWFTNKREASILNDLVDYFIAGHVKGVEETLQTIVLNSLSFHDVTTKKQESFYHGLVLGLSLAAENRYVVKSNRESGYGRYDIAWYPKDPLRDPGIVIELKVDATPADEALKQIDTKKYETDLQAHGCQKILHYGMHCNGKEMRVVSK